LPKTDHASPGGFRRIDNRTLRQAVLEQLRGAILNGKLPVGERLMEARIAEQMGVSRVPVREAIRHLEQEGLVVSYPHRGTTVACVDEDEVDLLYFLRAELEGAAIGAAMGRDAGALRKILGQLVDQMRGAARARNLVLLAEKDLHFHQIIVSSSGYQTLQRVWSTMDGPIRARMLRALAGPFQRDLVTYTAESHQPIVDALATGDPARAVAALKQHILETRQLLERGAPTADATAAS
jgi:DNA-binding GntR family transcriptional regulator